MAIDEKFDEIYQTMVKENADDMEIARREAQAENKHNHMIITVIILINIVLGVFVKNYGRFIPTELTILIGILILISWIILHKKIYHKSEKSKIEKYTMDFKTKVVGTMIKSFEEQLEFTPQHRIISNSLG